MSAIPYCFCPRPVYFTLDDIVLWHFFIITAFATMHSKQIRYKTFYNLQYMHIEGTINNKLFTKRLLQLLFTQTSQQ